MNNFNMIHLSVHLSLAISFQGHCNLFGIPIPDTLRRLRQQADPPWFGVPVAN